MNHFTLENQMEHSAICVCKDAQTKLDQSWDEIEKDFHLHERSTWILQVVLIRDEQTQSDTALTLGQMALNNAQLLSDPETWSCVAYSYNPDEMCFIVFVHEPQENPLLRSDVERQCREKVSEAGWHTYVMSHHKKESYDLFRSVYLNSIEGRYKATHGYYDPK